MGSAGEIAKHECMGSALLEDLFVGSALGRGPECGLRDGTILGADIFRTPVGIT